MLSPRQWLAALWLLSISSAALCVDPAQQLLQLNATIAELEQQLQQQRGSQTALEQQLAALTLQQNAIAQQQRQLAAQITANNHSLAQLDTRQQQLNDAVATQRLQASAVLAAHYKLGRQPQLKLLLNGQQPQQIKRQLNYYRYLVAARQQLLDSLNRDLLELTAVQSQQRQQRQTLVQQQRQQQSLAAQLEQSLSKQQQRGAELKKRIAAQRSELSQLQQQRQQLERVIAEATRRAAPALASRPIAELKGQLPRPAPGRVLHRFGERRDDQLRWQGWLIDARRGDPIALVHPGRVVYADYLRGYGLLVIVQHDPETLTLYAHNSELATAVGEQLNAGAIIAYAGDSGEQIGNALYFELRRDGAAVDPAQWLR